MGNNHSPSAPSPLIGLRPKVSVPGGQIVVPLGTSIKHKQLNTSTLQKTSMPGGTKIHPPGTPYIINALPILRICMNQTTGTASTLPSPHTRDIASYDRLHHLAHSLELLQQTVDFLERSAASVSNPFAAASVDDFRMLPFLRSH